MNKYNNFVGLFNEFYDINDIKIEEKNIIKSENLL